MAKTPATRVECAGGCGKFQMTRRIDPQWTYVGCGKCDGWKKIERDLHPVRYGMALVSGYGAVAGFQGLCLRIATQEERAAFGRARAILAAAV